MFAHLLPLHLQLCVAAEGYPKNPGRIPQVKIFLFIKMLFHEFKCSRNRAGFEMPRNICGIAAALLQNLHLIGAVNTEFKVEHRILPGIPILGAEQRNLVLG